MPNIVFQPSNKVFELPYNSLLTNVEEIEDHTLSFGCRSGACGSCVIEVLQGKDSLNNVDNDEKEFLAILGYSSSLYRLACCCRLRGDITIQLSEI